MLPNKAPCLPPSLPLLSLFESHTFRRLAARSGHNVSFQRILRIVLRLVRLPLLPLLAAPVLLLGVPRFAAGAAVFIILTTSAASGFAAADFLNLLCYFLLILVLILAPLFRGLGVRG